MKLNRHYGVVVQLINFLLRSLAASHDYYLMENGRADCNVSDGKSSPLHIIEET